MDRMLTATHDTLAKLVLECAFFLATIGIFACGAGFVAFAFAAAWLNGAMYVPHTLGCFAGFVLAAMSYSKLGDLLDTGRYRMTDTGAQDATLG